MKGGMSMNIPELDDEQVIRKYADTVYRPAYAQTRAKSDADDVFQEVFLRYVQNKDKIQSEEHLKAWLIRVTVNCSKKHWNSYYLRHTVPLDDTIVFSEPEETGLDEAMRRLNPKYRAVIHLYYYEGYSVAEIGQILNTNESTIRTQMTRARRQMKKFLEGE